jgi:hypothetical protein
MRVRVFLSYRRSDVGGYAGRLSDALSQRLGPRNVFQDVTAIDPGKDFTVAIDRALDESEAVLAVIGPGWVTASDPEGGLRLQQPDDYVRRELARALERDASVVPVLVGGAKLPTAAELPDDLQGLTQRQAVSLRDETWHNDVDALVRSLRGEPATPPPRRRRWLAGAALVALAAAAGTGYQLQRDGGGGDGTAVPVCPAATGEGWQPIDVDTEAVAQAPSDDGQLQFRVRSASWKPAGQGKWDVLLTTEMRNASPSSHSNGDWRYDYLAVALRENPVTCFRTTTDVVGAGKVSDDVLGFEVSCEPTGYLQLGVNGDSDTHGTLDVTPSSASSDC